MEDVLAVRDEYRLQGWAEIIRERQASGLTRVGQGTVPCPKMKTSIKPTAKARGIIFPAP